MARVPKNIANLSPKFNEFRKAEKFTDIIIVCEQRSFPCHRVVLATACPYFESMFSLPTRDREAESITIPNVTASTLQQILEFIYTGYTRIDSDNIFSLIVASDFLNLDFLEDLCLRHLKKMLSSVSFEGILDILSFAYATNKETFIKTIRSFLINNLKLFLRSEEFLQTPFNFLLSLLKDPRCTVQFGLLSLNETVEKALIRWINHSSEERPQYLNSFIELGFGMASFRELEMKSLNSCIELPGTREAVNYETSNSENTISLNLFVDCRDRQKYLQMADNYVRVLQVDKNFDCLATREFSQKSNYNHTMKCVAINNSNLFCLHYYSFESSIKRSEFSVRTLVDEQLEKILQSPPCVPCSYDLCEMQNGILFYDKSRCKNNMYLYDKELDQWFPMPQMIENKHKASVTVCNDTRLLYAVGGLICDDGCNPTNSFQAYDYRMERWNKLPNCIMKKSSAACCLYKGKVFVSGGHMSKKTKFCELYDPVAGKWEEFEPGLRSVAGHRIVPYENALWVVGGGTDVKFNLEIDKYDPVSNKWCTSWLLDKNEFHDSFKVLDAVVSIPFF